MPLEEPFLRYYHIQLIYDSFKQHFEAN